MLPLVLAVCCFGATPACDITIESAGGSKAGESYTFTVSSNAVPITVTCNVGGDQFHKVEVNEKQQSVTITIPADARGKTFEIVAENKDGCLVNWTETVQ